VTLSTRIDLVLHFPPSSNNVACAPSYDPQMPRHSLVLLFSFDANPTMLVWPGQLGTWRTESQAYTLDDNASKTMCNKDNRASSRMPESAQPTTYFLYSPSHFWEVPLQLQARHECPRMIIQVLVADAVAVGVRIVLRGHAHSGEEIASFAAVHVLSRCPSSLWMVTMLAFIKRSIAEREG
jgi:hypothetical protein